MVEEVRAQYHYLVHLCLCGFRPGNFKFGLVTRLRPQYYIGTSSCINSNSPNNNDVLRLQRNSW
jgi:hypothetical protein